MARQARLVRAGPPPRPFPPPPKAVQPPPPRAFSLVTCLGGAGFSLPIRAQLGLGELRSPGKLKHAPPMRAAVRKWPNSRSERGSDASSLAPPPQNHSAWLPSPFHHDAVVA